MHYPKIHSEGATVLPMWNQKISMAIKRHTVSFKPVMDSAFFQNTAEASLELAMAHKERIVHVGHEMVTEDITKGNHKQGKGQSHMYLPPAAQPAINATQAGNLAHAWTLRVANRDAEHPVATQVIKHLYRKRELIVSQISSCARLSQILKRASRSPVCPPGPKPVNFATGIKRKGKALPRLQLVKGGTRGAAKNQPVQHTGVIRGTHRRCERT